MPQLAPVKNWTKIEGTQSNDVDLATIRSAASEEAFALILTELRIMNRYLSEMNGFTITEEDLG